MNEQQSFFNMKYKRTFIVLGSIYSVVFVVWAVLAWLASFMSFGALIGNILIVVFWVLVAPAMLILRALPFIPPIQFDGSPILAWAVITILNLLLVAMASVVGAFAAVVKDYRQAKPKHNG